MDKNKEQSSSSAAENWSTKIFLCLAVLVMIIVPSTYFIKFASLEHVELSNDPAVWGQLGDYVGGLLNPFVSACAFIWLVISVNLQIKDLKVTQNHLAKSIDEQKTASKLASLNSMLDALNMNTNLANQDLLFFRDQKLKGVNQNSRNAPYISLLGSPLLPDELEDEITKIYEELKVLHTVKRGILQQMGKLAEME